MAKVLVIGMGPLLEEGVRMIGGQCLRTWHFSRPILMAGHPVKLATLPIPDHEKIEADIEPLTTEYYRGFEYASFNKNYLDFILHQLQQMIEEWQPECIVAVNQYAAYVACRLPTQLPIWADLNGYAMAEAQTQGFVYGDDKYLKHFWEQEFTILRRADKFSTVSRPQLFALLGELALLGRLNRFTFDYEFGVHIPNAVNEMFANYSGKDKTHHLRGDIVPQDAFVVLWSGGYNTWTDVYTLFHALEEAIAENARIHFVSTGGMVEGHDEVTYKNFQKLIEKSEYRDHYHLLGWIEGERLPPYYQESNVGINVDSYNYETVFGARNRLVNMMAMGLPILSSVGTEISFIIKDQRLGFLFPIGEVEVLKRLFLELVNMSEKELEAIGTRAREYALNQFSYQATTEALVTWLENPHLAPDNKERLKLGSNEHLGETPLHPLEQDIVNFYPWRLQSLYRSRELIDKLKQTPLYKLYRLFKHQ